MDVSRTAQAPGCQEERHLEAITYELPAFIRAAQSCPLQRQSWPNQLLSKALYQVQGGSHSSSFQLVQQNCFMSFLFLLAAWKF